MSTDQLRNSNWTQGHLSYANRNYFTPFQRQPGFYLLYFREKIKGMGCLESLVMMTSCFLSSLLDTHQKDEHHTLLTCQCDIFTGQHTPPSALVLYKLQQVHFISHLALYTFIALEQVPVLSIIKML